MTCDPLLDWLQRHKEDLSAVRADRLRAELLQELTASAPPPAKTPWMEALRVAVNAARVPLFAALGEMAYRTLYAACFEHHWRRHGLGFPMLAPQLVLGHMRLRTLAPDLKALIRAVCEAGDGCEGEEWLCWVHSKFTRPEIEEIDAFIVDGGKVDSSRAAARKTQFFTDRYMCEWMVQNSLGTMWTAICERQGWTPEVVSSGTLATLEERRAAWRALRESGEVESHRTPAHRSDMERRWCWFVPTDAEAKAPRKTVENAPASLDELRVLEPAVGTGAIVLAYLDHLLPLMEEEDRRRRRERSRAERAASAAQTLTAVDIDAACIAVCRSLIFARLSRYAGETVAPELNVHAPPVLELDGASEQELDDLALALAVDREELTCMWMWGGAGALYRYEAIARVLRLGWTGAVPLAEAGRSLALNLGDPTSDDPEGNGLLLVMGLCGRRYMSRWWRLGLGGAATGNLTPDKRHANARGPLLKEAFR